MTEFLQEHWGDLSSFVGLLVSLFGLIWAIKVAYGAKTAAEAARSGASKAARRIERSIGRLDLDRAIDLIQRLKGLHRENRWEVALEQYQSLREMISDISTAYPEWDDNLRQELDDHRQLIASMEQHVESQLARGIDDQSIDWMTMNRQLNQVQIALEVRASGIDFQSE